MKPIKPFVVEIKRNGRRTAQREQPSIWNPDELKSATEKVKDDQDDDTPELDSALNKHR